MPMKVYFCHKVAIRCAYLGSVPIKYTSDFESMVHYIEDFNTA